MPQTGERIAHYQLRGRLATGGMGIVYSAFDERTKRMVALKVLSAEFGGDPDYRLRFAQEAELAARVEHPNIVPLYDVGASPNLYIAMRLVPGTDLASELRLGPLPVERALNIGESVAAALDEAHRNQLVHRDVKPANVLLAPTRDRHRAEHVYLTDFGIARSIGVDLRLSRPVVVLGSPAYMAPERLRGEPGAAGCDVYGLGCVLFECFTGQRPFPHIGSPEEVARRNAVDPPRLSSLRPDLPRGLDEALFAAMSRHPHERPSTAGDLAAAARGAFRAPPMVGPPPPRTPRPQAPAVPNPYAPPAGPVVRKHRAVHRRRRSLLVGLVLLIAVVAALALTRGSSSPAPSTTTTSAAAQSLINRLPTAVFGRCAQTPSDSSVPLTTEVRCTGTDPRVDEILVRQAPDAASLNGLFSAVAQERALVTRRCSGETRNSEGFWTVGGTRQGPFACFMGDGPDRRLLWHYDSSLIEVEAVKRGTGASAASGLYDWWSNSVRTDPLNR